MKKPKFLGAVKALFSDYDELYSKFLKKPNIIVDGHPLPSLLLVFRITRKDTSKNSIKPVGGSNYLLIDSETQALLDNGNGQAKNSIMIGYDELSKNRYIVIDCGPNTTEEVNTTQ